MTSKRARPAPPARRAGATAARAGRPVEPSTLPAGIGTLNLVFFSLLVADLGAAGALLGQATNAATADAAPMIGVFLGVVYGCFPLQFLDGRAMIAVAGYRILLWAVLILHIPLVAVLALDFHAGMNATTSALFLTAPIAILGTPGLLLIGRALRSMKWLNPAAPPESWEPMPGIDGVAPAGPDGSQARTTPAAVALLLPFIAAYRARQPWLAACAASLWLGTAVLAPFAPWRAVLTFCLAAGIGQRAAATARIIQAGPAISPADRAAMLAGIFTQARLAAAPSFAAAGLLCLPWLFTIDFIALGAFLALPSCNSAASLIATLQNQDFAALVLLAVLFIPAMIFLPFGTTAAKIAFRCTACLLSLGELGLALLYAAISFHIGLAGHEIYVPAPVYPIIWPITLGLLAGIPFALITAAAVTTYGRVANLLAREASAGDIGGNGFA